MNSESKRRKRVAVLLSLQWTGAAEEANGVTDYAMTHGEWTILYMPPGFYGDTTELMQFEADGCIAGMNIEEELQIMRRRQIPVVGIGSELLPTGLLPRVVHDNAAIGRMAARHFLDRGFRRLAYIGPGKTLGKRGDSFVVAASSSRAVVSVFMVPVAVGSWAAWDAILERLGRWLRELSHPVGVMAADDIHARMVLDACYLAELRVPDDVAILGAGNSIPICECCEPQLSSIDEQPYQLGYQAAALLDRLMAKQDVPDEDVLVPPKGVTQRRSTQVLAIEDPHVRTAVDYVHEHIGESYGVEQLVAQIPISRRSLENAFLEQLNCTPHEYLRRTRVAKAKDLLVSFPRMELQSVAAACGFHSSKRLRMVFESLTGKTPADYRRQKGLPHGPGPRRAHVAPNVASTDTRSAGGGKIPATLRRG